ncbi:restriction endonuclease subunit S [Roseovarius sp. SCSIO 43702]|uniref:restriction endonuclease subunit S n=1 Tax=Roseovarius sp. SCSIO 43702 TaxID=2823043 RepID=UPI001C732601|nr:restriction endonuclease subunit S [Roseovarius sp. SCSIO 43702]QYX58053.1 restriction endonuclease subunit S [Roseovarius sp. SCSIO 43702]
MRSFSEVRIGDVAKAKGGKRLPKGASVQDAPTPHPYLRVVDFGESGINRSAIKYIDENVHHQVRRYTITSSDIYISIAGTIGRVGMVPEDLSGANLTENAAKLTDISHAVDARYLMYFLRGATGKAAMSNQTGGTSQPKLALYRIEEIRFPCPPRSEQEAIVSILSAYDDLIETNRRRIALLEDAARLLYREWFVHFRFPGHEHVPLTDGLPEGWARQTFDDVCETIGGGTPKTEKPEFWNDGDIPWYTPTDITRNSCLALLDSATKITEAGLRGSSAKMLPAGTVLMTSRASVGFFGIIETPSCTNQGFISIIPHDPRARMYLLHNLMYRVEEIRSHAGGATYKEISKGKFRALPVVIPDAALLREFEHQASTLHAQVRTLHTQNQKLAQARDLLLPRLMNGEIAV